MKLSYIANTSQRERNLNRKKWKNLFFSAMSLVMSLKQALSDLYSHYL